MIQSAADYCGRRVILFLIISAGCGLRLERYEEAIKSTSFEAEDNPRMIISRPPPLLSVTTGRKIELDGHYCTYSNEIVVLFS